MLDNVSCVPIFARLLLLLDEGLFNWCQCVYLPDKWYVFFLVEVPYCACLQRYFILRSYYFIERLAEQSSGQIRFTI